MGKLKGKNPWWCISTKNPWYGIASKNPLRCIQSLPVSHGRNQSLVIRPVLWLAVIYNSIPKILCPVLILKILGGVSDHLPALSFAANTVALS